MLGLGAQIGTSGARMARGRVSDTLMMEYRSIGGEMEDRGAGEVV